MNEWKKHFEALGKLDVKDKKFDEVEEKSIREEVERIESVRDEGEGEGEWYNGVVSRDEVVKAMGICVAGKAMGVDKVKNEFVKRGGVVMVDALHELMNVIWKEEYTPDEWNDATITPIHKSGPTVDVNNYRGIALMSVVIKIYESIIKERLTKTLEKRNMIVEEQGGFREGRGCIDQIFTLNEIIESRREKNKRTYIAFLDFTKAYDIVWREGMWYQLHRMGIRGKAWRVVKNMYRKVRSCVKIKGMQSEWWSSGQGVRQGSVLSPLLFSVAINGVINYMRRRGHGIKIGEDNVPGLLFADDLAIIEESAERLHEAMRDLDEWAQRNRFVFNATKCGVVVAGRRKKEGEKQKEKWMIGGKEVEEKDSYKYLGIEKERMRGWKEYVKRMIGKARSRIGELMMVGVHQCGLRPSMDKRLTEILMRPLLEYGYEVVEMNKSQSLEVERVMLQAGRLITGLPKCAMSDAIRGELGWSTMEERREVGKLKYFHRLRLLPNTRLVKRVLIHRMKEAMEAGMKNYVAINRTPAKRTSWCDGIFRIMWKYGISDQWRVDVKEEESVAVWRWWKGVKEGEGVQKRVEEKQHQLWQERVKEKTKGKYYLKCKKEWGEEEYMNENGSKKGRIWKTRMRTSTVPLQAIIKQEHRHGIPVLIDTCAVCGTGAVENQQHMLVECDAYSKEREEMYSSIQKYVFGIDDGSNEHDHVLSSGSERNRDGIMVDIDSEVDHVMRSGIDRAHCGIIMVDIDSKVDPVMDNWREMESEDLAVWLLSDPKCDFYVRSFLDNAFRIRSSRLGD